jgi:hypothetical protein
MWNMQALSYNRQRFESKRTAVKKMATPLHKREVFWGNKAKSEKRMQRRYRTEFAVDPPSKPSIYEELWKTCSKTYA